MKQVILGVFMFMMAVSLTGCEKIASPSGGVNLPSDNTPISGETDLKNPKLNPEEPLHGNKCLFTYGSMIVGENLSSEDREWEGYHKLGNKVGKVPTRMLFSADGNIKMYTKPMKTEDWQLVKDFNIDRMKVPTDDEHVDDIVKFPKLVDYCLFKDTKENASKDFPCITLYPKGAPIQANSPFNVKACVKSPGNMTVTMLKHTIYLHQ